MNRPQIVSDNIEINVKNHSTVGTLCPHACLGIHFIHMLMSSRNRSIPEFINCKHIHALP